MKIMFGHNLPKLFYHDPFLSNLAYSVSFKRGFEFMISFNSLPINIVMKF